MLQNTRQNRFQDLTKKVFQHTQCFADLLQTARMWWGRRWKFMSLDPPPTVFCWPILLPEKGQSHFADSPTHRSVSSRISVCLAQVYIHDDVVLAFVCWFFLKFLRNAMVLRWPFWLGAGTTWGTQVDLSNTSVQGSFNFITRTWPDLRMARLEPRRSYSRVRMCLLLWCLPRPQMVKIHLI